VDVQLRHPSTCCHVRSCVRHLCLHTAAASLVFASALVPATAPCRAPVTALNLEGYGLAFAAVCWYNYQKLIAMQTAKPTPAAEQEVGGWRAGNAGRGLRWLRVHGSMALIKPSPSPDVDSFCLPACLPVFPPLLAEGR
jgi:hypothetical protein